MADVRFDQAGHLTVDGHAVERRDWGQQMRTTVVNGVETYDGYCWRTQLRIYAPKGKILEAFAVIPVNESETGLEQADRMNREIVKCLGSMSEAIKQEFEPS